MIRIQSDIDACSTKISKMDGTPIDGISAITIRIAAGDMVRAEIEVATQTVDVLAHEFLGLDTVRAAAAAHGFDLVERNF